MNNIKIKRIFSFWEPKNTVPDYLKLCIESWKKYLPEYEIIILSYSNLFDWLEKDFYDEILYEDFSYPMQSDAIRAALLYKYGGIWMDIDTIITSSKVNDLISDEFDFNIIASHIAFLKAKAGCKIFEDWMNIAKEKIESYKNFKLKYQKMSFIRKFLNKKILKKYKNWDYLGNSILNSLILKYNDLKINQLNKDENYAFCEYNWAKENNKKINSKKIYKEFYFKNDYSNYVLLNNKGIICLHNSWTGEKYKKMDKNEFLKQNNTLSKIFKKIL